MSTLLEQAIVDAEALREAAMKNAEASIVEKYSSEVKAAVESLLSEEFEEELDEEEESDESPVMNEVPYANEDGDSPVTVRLDLEALERALNEEGSTRQSKLTKTCSRSSRRRSRASARR